VFSALHKDGERLHRLARSGREVSADPREVEISDLTLLKNNGSSICIDVTASRGTYVRSLARDIAHSLGTCGYLSKLHRLRIGSFSVENAISVDEVEESTTLLSMVKALQDFPKLEIEEKIAHRVRNGIPAPKILQSLEVELPQSDYICLVNDDRLVAIVELKQKPGYFKVYTPS
jgi:tRNA pseudouridine55 synthase